MKRILLLAFLFIGTNAIAQRSKFKKLPKAIIKVSPQHLVRNGLKAGVEFFNEDHKFSNEIMFEVIAKNNNVFNNPDALGKISTSGFIIDYGFKYYFDGLRVKKTLVSEKVSGFYMGFGVQGGSYKETHGMVYDPQPQIFPSKFKYSQIEVTSTMFNAAISGGINKEIANRVYLDFNFGIGIQSGSNKISEDDIKPQEIEYAIETSVISPYARGILPRLGLKLGIGI